MRIFIASFACKRLLLFVFLLSLAGMVFAVDVEIKAPHFSGGGAEIQGFLDEINGQLGTFFDEYAGLISSDIDNFLPGSFNNLAGAFANASVFSSDGASQRGYEGYKTFSFTAGFMGALQFPKQFTLLDEIMDAIKGGEGEIGFFDDKDKLDIGIGLDIKALNAQFGINTSKFLLKGLYFGFKFSMFETNWIKAIAAYFPDFSFKTMSVGINTSYQLISQKRLLLGLFVWRGLNLSAGFTWQKTSFELTSALPIDEELLNFQFEGITMPFTEVMRFGINTNTYIIPVEAMTSIRLLGFLNVALGAGVDIAFGSSNINAHGSLDVGEITGLPPDVIMDTPPILRLSLGGKSAPSIFNPKAMGAVGFNFGPVIIDIPVTYYFLDNGYSLGVTFGFTF